MNWEDQDVARRFKLIHAVEDLILRGKRPRGDIEALDRALQLFKEGQLEGVVPKGLPEDLSLENLFAFFETPIESVGLTEEAIVILREHGIRLVGEILRFKWEFKFKGGEAIHQLFLRRHIPVSTDPWSLGWRPAYLKDSAVREALHVSGAVLFKEFNVWDPNPLEQSLAFNGPTAKSTPEVGQSIARLSKGQGQLEHRRAEDLQKLLLRVPVLHAAMYLPEDYVDDPNTTSAEIIAFEARERRARDLVKTVFADDSEWKSTGMLRQPFSRDDRVREAELARRRTALVTALKAEGMSPHFFAVATKLNRYDFKSTKTIREFLAVDGSWDFFTRDWQRGIVDHLAAWGLRLEMNKQELDELFGPETATSEA